MYTYMSVFVYVGIISFITVNLKTIKHKTQLSWKTGLSVSNRDHSVTCKYRYIQSIWNRLLIVCRWNSACVILEVSKEKYAVCETVHITQICVLFDYIFLIKGSGNICCHVKNFKTVICFMLKILHYTMTW